jgi:5-hydroxyisourate hydrolase
LQGDPSRFYQAKGHDSLKAKLTTHVLDTANGRPAAAVAIRLFACRASRELLAECTTNADGRTAGALLEGAALATGCYELEFDIGDYFRRNAVSLSDPAFLETVLIRVSLRAGERYHVPLLVSPWSYSTYRGS